jgi:hypothetical protein
MSGLDLVAAIAYNRAAKWLDTQFDLHFESEPALRRTLDDAFRVGYLAAINDLATEALRITEAETSGPHAPTWGTFDDVHDGVCD